MTESNVVLQRIGPENFAEVCLIKDEAQHPEVVVSTNERREILLSALRELPAREELILRLHYGLDNETSMQLKEIAKILGISRERVRQLEARALHILRTEIGILQSIAADWLPAYYGFNRRLEREDPWYYGSGHGGEVVLD
jgi:DNA-directed RNA polymerase sigma subunit (sigma70/sigma32)